MKISITDINIECKFANICFTISGREYIYWIEDQYITRMYNNTTRTLKGKEKEFVMNKLIKNDKAKNIILKENI